jgi:hypothetical protein
MCACVSGVTTTTQHTPAAGALLRGDASAGGGTGATATGGTGGAGGKHAQAHARSCNTSPAGVLLAGALVGGGALGGTGIGGGAILRASVEPVVM